MTTTAQVQAPEAIAGALFDFAGFLTTLPKERAVTLSGAHLATPVVDLLTEWAKTRGLNLDEANVKGWVAALTAAPTNTDTNTASGAATREIEDCPELNLSNYDLVDVDRLNDWAIRADAEIDRLRTALAAPAQPAEMTDVENLRKALQFYADGEHFIKSDDSAWDTVSGEPQNYWCDEAGTATVEDGSIARLALEGRPIRFEEDDSALPPAPSTEGESNG